MLRTSLFVVVTALLAYVSGESLRRVRAHGFYRFLAWECILGLILLNFVSLRQWFADPTSLRQIASWLLLCGSIVPGLWGTMLLRAKGGLDARRSDDPALIAFEKTSRLVTTGIYAYIRHPMYGSLLYLAWGVFFKRPSWISGVLVVASTAFLVLTARFEEVEDLHYFGDFYRAYMRGTKMFVPFVL